MSLVNGRPWLYVTDQAPADTTRGTYSGPHVIFQGRDNTSVMRDAVGLNPGILNGDPAKLNSCFDVGILVNGQSITPTIEGEWTDPNTGQVYPAGIKAPPNTMDLGGQECPFRKVYTLDK